MQPAQGVRFIHIALCREAHAVEALAAAAEAPDDLGALDARVAWFAQINKLHTDGEESSIFHDLELKLPHVGAAYIHDHREDLALFEHIRRLIVMATQASAATRGDALAKLRRQTIALTEHVLPHIEKEDHLITPLLVENFTPAEQGAQIGRMMAGFGPDVMMKALPWLVAHLDAADQHAYVGMLQRVMPAERFPIACGWIKAGITPEAYQALCAAVPGVPA